MIHPLPHVMVAPNGARLTKADHPSLPVTISETVDAAVACARAGADGIHAHVRDADATHVLDAGMYSELLAELRAQLPDGFYTQITTEAVGRYTPNEQRSIVRALTPTAVSIALREITDGEDDADTARFFAFCAEAGIGVQHILYDEADVAHLIRLVGNGTIPEADIKTLVVLGRYTKGQVSDPADLSAPATLMLQHLPAVDWGICAFGAAETDCLLAAHRMGGKARIGFENNRTNRDGTIALDNAERVAEYIAARDGEEEK